jgi:hypothetical protein
MAGDYASVAGFAGPVGAEIAGGRLASEGIPTVISGGLAASTVFGIGNLGGRVEVRVPAEHVARAVAVLASRERRTPWGNLRVVRDVSVLRFDAKI